jgi:cyclopropane-fatty-acyl-phospholipid synthase
LEEKMPVINSKNRDPESITLHLLDEIFGDSGAKIVTVRLWNGTIWKDDAPKPVTLVLKHPGALRAMFLPGTEVGLAEAYLYDDFDIEGDIESVFSLADQLSEKTLGWRKKLRTANQLLHLPTPPDHPYGKRGPARPSGRKHSIERDRQAVTYHYDVSNEFYALWLGKRMVYSCAYFESTDDDLDTAQERKLDYICRKLRLKPGQRLLDIGCGWGGLVIYAAEKYGVNAIGITLSQPQANLANERISAAGLSDRCRVEVCDYRQFDDTQGFDGLVSVGMFEHVGADLYQLILIGLGNYSNRAALFSIMGLQTQLMRNLLPIPPSVKPMCSRMVS